MHLTRSHRLDRRSVRRCQSHRTLKCSVRSRRSSKGEALPRRRWPMPCIGDLLAPTPRWCLPARSRTDTPMTRGTTHCCRLTNELQLYSLEVSSISGVKRELQDAPEPPPTTIAAAAFLRGALSARTTDERAADCPVPCPAHTERHRHALGTRWGRRSYRGRPATTAILAPASFSPLALPCPRSHNATARQRPRRPWAPPPPSRQSSRSFASAASSPAPSTAPERVRSRPPPPLNFPSPLGPAASWRRLNPPCPLPSAAGLVAPRQQARAPPRDIAWVAERWGDASAGWASACEALADRLAALASARAPAQSIPRIRRSEPFDSPRRVTPPTPPDAPPDPPGGGRESQTNDILKPLAPCPRRLPSNRRRSPRAPPTSPRRSRGPSASRSSGWRAPAPPPGARPAGPRPRAWPCAKRHARDVQSERNAKLPSPHPSLQAGPWGCPELEGGVLAGHQLRIVATSFFGACTPSRAAHVVVAAASPPALPPPSSLSHFPPLRATLAPSPRNHPAPPQPPHPHPTLQPPPSARAPSPSGRTPPPAARTPSRSGPSSGSPRGRGSSGSSPPSSPPRRSPGGRWPRPGPSGSTPTG